VKGALYEIRSGEGTLGKLVKSNDVYAEALLSLQDVRKMVASVKQNSDAIKSLPVVRSYVVDAHKELVRPECRWYRKWFREKDLFEPGGAALTDDGKKLLDDIADWINEDKASDQAVIIAAFAAPGQDAEYARTVTQKQAEAVCEYLRSNHRVHRTGFWYWSNRDVRALGVGTNPPAIPGNERLPAARIEVNVFWPRAS
jgi:outer membrane protein OmpA-like peptidoglycan-associated protein